MGANKTATSDMNDVISMYPAYKLNSDASLGVLAFGDLMAGWTKLTVTTLSAGMKQLPGGLYSGPLVFFDSSRFVIIIAPFNHFTAASYVHDTQHNTLAWGIMGNVDDVPQGYSLQTMMFYSDKGINQV